MTDPTVQHETRSSVKPRLREWLGRASLQDMIRARSHSQDFSGSRAEYIYMRVRLLAFVFAVLAPLWIPIDLAVLPAETFASILALRLAFSGLFLLLGLWTVRPHDLNAARLRLLLFILIPGLFYGASRLVLGGDLQHEGVLAGYSFVPFLWVALLAVFPLTLLEGAFYAGLVTAFFIAAEWHGHTLFSIPTLGQVWLLLLLAVIAVWAQLAQLHMLLRLYREATRDALTGLVNRRVLFKWLGREVAEAHAAGKPLAVLLFDLDLFKRINDTHGHLTGDAVLRAFGEILHRQLTPPALIGRYGGEEFLAILPGDDLESARLAAEAVRRSCHEHCVIGVDGAEVTFTSSVGIATLTEGEDAESLLSRVDQGLYRAKEAGRDLVAEA